MPKICKVDNCNNKSRTWDLCVKHYERFRKFGDVNKTTHLGLSFCTIFGCNRKYCCKGMCFNHYYKKWKKEHPRSSYMYSVELQLAMNNVRKRDQNTCKWYNCGLKSGESVTIHVRHIFPKSEYPNLELIEKYMICYCSYHHKLWHQKRGDRCQFIIPVKPLVYNLTRNKDLTSSITITK